ATVRSSRSRDPRRRPSFPTRRSSDLIRGVVEEGVSVFKGVPYGGDTSGANRWMPPRDPEPWTGVRDALEYGPQAAQGNGSGSEDCLVLNLFTPGIEDGGRRPVMLWLHGGGFSTLSASSAMYDGVNLCNRGDVV